MIDHQELYDFFINEFDQYYLKSDDIKNKLHNDITLNLLLMLSKLTFTKSIIDVAQNDKLFLNIILDDLLIYDFEYIKDLLRSGLVYDIDDDNFYINVQ